VGGKLSVRLADASIVKGFVNTLQKPNGTTASLDQGEQPWMGFMSNARKRIIVSDAEYVTLL
jgi:hypothetical protein